MDISQLVSLKGLQTNKAAFDVVSKNLANANNPNYNSRVVEFSEDILDGKGYGARIADIKRNLDSFLQTEVRRQSSKLSSDQTLNKYHERIQILFGDPMSENTIGYQLNEFFSMMNRTANNPEFKQQVVQSGLELSNKISSIASDLYNCRYDADREFAEKLNVINNAILQVQTMQQQIGAAGSSGVDITSLLDSRDYYIDQIAENIDINVALHGNTMFLTTDSGISLLDNTAYQLSYSQVLSPSIFVADSYLENVIVYPDSGSVDNKSNQVLVKGGTTGNVTSKITNGNLDALLRIRDVDIPEIIAELDNLAMQIRDNINKIHNTSGSVPASPSLTGTKMINANDYQWFSGQARIAVLNNEGQTLLREDDTTLDPLLLNFSSMNSGEGNGSIKMQTLVDEINQYYYYDPLMNKLKLGNLSDVRIASLTDNMVANGVFNFNFELVNSSQYDSVFTVDSIDVYDNTSTLVAGALTTTVPISCGTSPGDRVRTSELSVNFGAGAGGPYTLQVNMKVKDENGIVSPSVVTFVIDDTPSGGADIMNDRYVASTIVSGSASMYVPNLAKRYLRADIVDSNGDPVSSSNSGYLKLTTILDGSGVIIDDLTSQDAGYTYVNGLEVDATYRGISHFLGLNNFFTDNYKKTNSAYNMKVRSDITNDSSLFCVGKIAQSPSKTKEVQVGVQQAEASLSFVNNPAINSTITVNGVVFTYVAAAAANNQITLGATLSQTLYNTINALNATNSTTSGYVEQATYSTDGVDNLYVTYDAKGSIGNSMNISYNLLGGATASINSSPQIAANSANLLGGYDAIEAVIVTPNSYEIGVGAAQGIIEMSQLTDKSISFSSTTRITSTTTTISGYAAILTSVTASLASQVEQEYKNQISLYDALHDKLKEGSGVDIDKEMATTILYQQAYAASANIMSTSQKLFELLMNSIRS